MLDVKRDRLDYGRLLTPPEGYMLSRAVGATYSADLDTLLSIPVALHCAQTLDGEVHQHETQLIRGIQNIADRLTVYHQVGCLKVPKHARRIHAFLEDALVPILPGDAFTAFHPKLWVIRFESVDDPSDVTFRLLVLSRNLTFDRSWDLAACLNGAPGRRPLEWNQPLVDTVAWLREQRDFEGAEGFLDELARVDFEVPEGFDDFSFHIMGIPGAEPSPMKHRRSKRMLCVSPFIDGSTLQSLVEHTQQSPILLSRRDQLQHLPPDLVAQLEAYCLSELIIDGERVASVDDSADEPQEQNLHAKLFLFDEPKATTWYLGSANATMAAAERNIEFMIELKGSCPPVRLDAVCDELLDSEQVEGLFEAFTPDEAGLIDEEEQKRQRIARQIEYVLMGAPVSGEIKTSSNGTNYDVRLTIDLSALKRRAGLRVWARPYDPVSQLRLLRLGERNEIVFENLALPDLSRFVHFKLALDDADSHEFLRAVELSGMPSGRLDAVFRSVISNSEKFFSYLRFLLSDELDKRPQDPHSKASGGGHAGEGAPDGWLTMPVYEQLLIAASREPAKLVEVDRAVKSLVTSQESEDAVAVVPEQFVALWEVFRSMMEEKGGRRG